MDVLTAIGDHIRGYRRFVYSIYRSETVVTDRRARLHDWDERELAVLERIQLLTAKPILYILNVDAEEFANASVRILRKASKSDR